MFYAVYDAEGRITQAQKIYAGPDHQKSIEDRMHDLGHKFVKQQRPGILPPELYMASTRPGSIVPLHGRPVMRVSVSSTQIKAGGTDAAVLTGIPKDAQCTVHGAGEVLWSVPIPDGELELNIPVPVVYRVVITKWPYQDFKVDIEAIA